ncbi:hypothetical protein [Derxia gummosa]|uniref:TolB amino-terminal domain-containing protein n=1 Tax=Derxia gummosa DSM 723 TaxID=1121388 RepID=A0A8B6X3H4_9BURK|nr:hypothetical protein [Derxia gummosa]
MAHHVTQSQASAIQSATGGFPEPGTVRVLMERLLNSPQLIRSRRLVRLIQHIVDATLAGQRRELSEMAIGLAVFDRDPATYNPAEDPIVRVQARRLRDKLAAYYEADGRDDAWQIVVPCGGYVAVFRQSVPFNPPGHVAGRRASASNDLLAAPAASLTPASGASGELIVAPLVSLNVEPRDHRFVDGVNEELIGAIARVYEAEAHSGVPLAIRTRLGTTDRRAPGGDGRAHVLEGSIRRAGNRARASLRLSCADDGRVLWAGQFDEAIDDELAAQEALCAAVIRAIGTLRPLLC